MQEARKKCGHRERVRKERLELFDTGCSKNIVNLIARKLIPRLVKSLLFFNKLSTYRNILTMKGVKRQNSSENLIHRTITRLIVRRNISAC